MGSPAAVGGKADGEVAMSIAEDFAASQKAYSDLLRHVERYSADISRGYQGVSHRQNQQAAEIEDLWKKVDKIAAYLKKKFPEDFTGDKS